MKALIFAGIIALAMASQAQTTQSTTPSKQAAKKAVSKKASVRQGEPTAATQNAMAPKADVAPAPAAATSVATTTAPAAPAKKWAAKVVLDAFTSNEGAKNIATAEINSINYIGATYKVTDKETAGLRQYFSYDSIPGQDTKVKQDFTVLTLGTKLGSFMGSEPVAPLFWYYLPTSTAMEKNFGRQVDGSDVESYGLLRADASLDWTLSPKWSVGYYLNPRQSLFPTQNTILNGKAILREAATRLIHYGSVTYTVNDMIQPYAYAGFDHQMATERLTSTTDKHLAGIGANFVFFGGKFILNPEINTEVTLKSGGQVARAPRWYQSEAMTYELVTAVSF